MIQKKINYCWFGGNSKPTSVMKCIKSWQKYCPDYEIIEWNEKNFDIHCNQYVEEAYNAKKWSFVTDYARLWIIYNYGGIYFDTDVEVIKNIDEFLQYSAFLGLEDDIHVATGLGFGAEKKNAIVKIMMDGYKNIHFVSDTGKLDLMPCPERNTLAISQYLKNAKIINGIKYIEHAAIFPKEYFCPLDYETKIMRKTTHTYTIHWFDASWKEESEKILHEYNVKKNKYCKRFGEKIGNVIEKLIYRLCYPQKRKILKEL